MLVVARWWLYTNWGAAQQREEGKKSRTPHNIRAVADIARTKEKKIKLAAGSSI